MLSLSSPFGDLAELWLADLALRDIGDGTKENYRTTLRLHVRPAFEHHALGEINKGPPGTTPDTKPHGIGCSLHAPPSRSSQGGAPTGRTP